MDIPSFRQRLGLRFRNSSEKGKKSVALCESTHRRCLPLREEARTSGIERLPGEILELVFFHTIQDRDAGPRYLIDIGLTCRRWRAVVLLSASLWSRLPPIRETQISTPTSPDIERLSNIVTLFLRRSGDHPLHFRLCTLTHPFRSREEPLAAILSSLVSQCHRWENTSLAIGLQLLETASDISGKLPILNSLDLTIFTPMQDSGSSHIINHFARCPSLRQVSLAVAAQGNDDVRVNIPWSQVENFSDHKWTPTGSRRLEFQDMAGQVAGIDCWMSTASLSFIQQELSRVRTGDMTKLSLSTGTSPATLEWFANELTLPKLTDLELFFRSDDITCLPLTDLHSFVRRSKCSLKQLRLDRAFCEPGVLAQILSLCGDDMEEMTVPIIPAEDLRQLTLDPSGARVPLVPKLRALEVLVNHMSYGDIRIFDGSALTEMALSRDLDSFSRQRSDVAALGVRVRAPGRSVDTYRLMFHRLEENSHSPERSSVVKSARPKAEQMIAGWARTLRGLCLPHTAPGWGRFRPTPLHDAGEPFDRVLKEMENYPTAELDVMLLRKYSIPKILDHGRCTTLSPRCRQCERVYRLSIRLEEIRESWRPTIVSEIASYQRWTVMRPGGWTYLPLQSRRRQSDEPWSIATEREIDGQTVSDSRYHDAPQEAW